MTFQTLCEVTVNIVIAEHSQSFGLFYYDNPQHCGQGRRRRFLTLIWILQFILYL